MNLITQADYKILVNEELKRQFSDYQQTLSDADPLYKDLVHTLNTFIARGGKRLRPYLLYLTYTGAGGINAPALLPIAGALELLHSFLLIHDDIIDQDTVRYGDKNIQGIYKDFFSELPSPEIERNATNVALLAGNIIHLLSNRAVMQASFSDELKIALFEIMNDITLSVAHGELVDSLLALGLPGLEISEQRIISLYYHKTATYTFELPLRMGIVLAGRTITSHAKNDIKKLATALGIAYQIKDDLLGVFGNRETTGKSDDGDIREGKRTLLYARAIAVLDGDQLIRFKALYGKSTISNMELEEVRNYFQTQGIRADIERQCDDLCDQSRALLHSLSLEQPVETSLQTLISSLQCRTS